MSSTLRTADAVTPHVDAVSPVGVDRTRPRVPMTRLIAVELRKLVDTRAGFWLAATIGLASVLIAAGLLVFAEEDFLTFADMLPLMNIPTAFLLPVLAIMLVTSEWSQRTGLVTFTLEPRRSRIVVAKLATALVAAVGAVLLALAFTSAATLLAGALHGGAAGSWNLTAAGVVGAVVVQFLGLLMGFAFAMILMNTPAAIVAFFVLPQVWTVLSAVVPWIRDNLQEWADTNVTQQPLFLSEWPTGGEWARIAVASSIWVVLPLALGIWRLLRSEVK